MSPQSLQETTVAILAGGYGKRLRSVVSDRQKIMALVDNRPFVYYLFDALVQVGINRVILCVGYLGEQVQSILGEEYKGMQLIYSFEPGPLGTGGALRNATPFLKSDHVMILNGDSFCQVDLTAFWNFHIMKQSSATLTLVKVQDVSSYGKVDVDSEDAILKFVEKGQSGSGWINAGVYLIKKSLINSIPDGIVSIEKDIFPNWVGQGLFGYCCNGKFLDIGTPTSYGAAEKFF